MTGTVVALTPQVMKQIRPSPQPARSASRTLSRWRHGFEPRRDYHLRPAETPDYGCSGSAERLSFPLSVPPSTRGHGGRERHDPRMGVLLALTALAACESQSASSQDVATVRAAGDAMEESGSFTVEMTIRPRDAGAPTSTQSTISGRVDLSGGRSTFEARSSDEDAWTELVVDGVAYQSRGEIVNAPDWCAVPLSNLDGNALIQTGPLFGDVPDLLRSATGASVVPDASTADSTAYRLTVPMRETALPAARVEGDEVTVWLDDMSRLVRAEFVISLGDRPRLVGPVRSNEATGDVLPGSLGLTSQAELALPLQGAEMREERHSLPAAARTGPSQPSPGAPVVLSGTRRAAPPR